MKKIILFICLFLFMISVSALEHNSKYVYVYNIKENKVMYEVDSNKEIPVASLTKIMTAIIAIENNSNLDKEVIIMDRDLKDMYEYAVAGFRVGDKVTIRDLLYGVLLPSGSDAVNALIRSTSNTEEEFVKLMNDKVKELGLNNTHFSNGIGKDEGNYSSMHDMAEILIYALNNNTFKEIFTTRTYKVGNLELKGPLTRLESALINGAKTGFTYDSMYSLASFSRRDDFDYIVVTSYANSYKNVMSDHSYIYNYYFNNYGYKDYNINFNIPIKNSEEESYNINIDTKYYLENNYNKGLLTYKYNGIEEITKKIKKGDKLGIVSIYYNNDLLEEKEIYLNKEIKYKNHLILVITGIIVGFLLIILFRKKKKR